VREGGHGGVFGGVKTAGNLEEHWGFCSCLPRLGQPDMSMHVFVVHSRFQMQESSQIFVFRSV